MCRWTVYIGLAVSFCCDVVLAAPVMEQLARKTLTIQDRDTSHVDQLVEQQIVRLASDLVNTSDNVARLPVLSSLASGQQQRLLVRLKEQALRPHLKQVRSQLSKTGKLSRTDMRQQLQKLSLSHQQVLQKNQSQILSELRKQKLLLNVHRQFTQLTNTISITASSDAIEQIRRLPQVAGVYPDSNLSLFLTDSVPVTEAPSLWAMQDSQGRSLTGKGVTVAIIDTGIDHTHPDLGGCIGPGCKVVSGYNFIEGEDTSNSMDSDGHGTHVAGIVAANGALTGMAPDASLYAYKVMRGRGADSDSLISTVIAALEKAADPDGNPMTDDHIDIVNLSLGTLLFLNASLDEAANNAMAEGIMVIVAAGNTGSTLSDTGLNDISSPANAEQVLTVGAMDNNGIIPEWSARGQIAGRNYIKPELVAPGVDVNSTVPNGRYERFSGTSMAAPHVAGAAALLKQLYPELTPAELKLLLVNNAADLGNDVFTQGAGAMKLSSAAKAKVLVRPSLFSAGSVDTTQSSWTNTIPISVKNLTNASVTMRLDEPERFPAGVSTNVVPSLQEFVPGQEFAFNFTLTVDTQELPYPSNRTLHHEMVANLQVDAQVVRLPLVLTKVASDSGQLVFDNLPDLVIEATGIETSYRLPSVTATDLTDGALAATTTNLGPYKIGQNLIVWRVTNSQGKSAFANQLLTVRDTTPPVINLPPNIRVVATGEFTEVSLGEASAIDLVDGKIIPSTNTVGPFVTGNYSVVWTAVDSRGNKSTAIQTLVVEPRNVTSTSSSTANLSGGGGGGGGGAIGWFLMLILILTPRVRNNDCAAKIGKIALCLMICPRKAITKHSTV